MKRVILVFLKLPVPGKVKTRLAESIGDEAAAAAYEKLVTAVFERCGEALADRIVIAFDPPEKADQVKDWLAPRIELLDSEVSWIAQSPGDLGERLHSASQAIFQEHPGTLLSVIGTDCIHLDPDLFERTRMPEPSQQVVLRRHRESAEEREHPPVAAPQARDISPSLHLDEIVSKERATDEGDYLSDEGANE